MYVRMHVRTYGGTAVGNADRRNRRSSNGSADVCKREVLAHLRPPYEKAARFSHTACSPLCRLRMITSYGGTARYVVFQYVRTYVRTSTGAFVQGVAVIGRMVHRFRTHVRTDVHTGPHAPSREYVRCMQTSTRCESSLLITTCVKPTHKVWWTRTLGTCAYVQHVCTYAPTYVRTHVRTYATADGYVRTAVSHHARMHVRTYVYTCTY